jgi:phospholipid-binding lipoprotein MlaA
LRYLRLIALLLAFSLIGCAHKQVADPLSASSGVSHDYNQETDPAVSNPDSSDPEEIEEGFSDEDLGFFGEGDSEEEAVQVADPIAPWNRAMFYFNDKLYFWILKPVAKGYSAVVPKPARSGIRNFFHNLTMPVRMVSCLLQGKGRAASAELTKFLINSTVGVLGFGDPAARWDELKTNEEDLGQTLGTYGIGQGFYIVWPFLGPSTLRDSIGMIGDWFLDPVSYVNPSEAAMGTRATDIVNKTSFRIGDYESLKEAAIDPYVALRNLYIQNRKKKIKE